MEQQTNPTHQLQDELVGPCWLAYIKDTYGQLFPVWTSQPPAPRSSTPENRDNLSQDEGNLPTSFMCKVSPSKYYYVYYDQNGQPYFMWPNCTPLTSDDEHCWQDVYHRTLGDIPEESTEECVEQMKEPLEELTQDGDEGIQGNSGTMTCEENEHVSDDHQPNSWLEKNWLDMQTWMPPRDQSAGELKGVVFICQRLNVNPWPDEATLRQRIPRLNAKPRLECYRYEISPQGSLLVEDSESAIFVYISGDLKECALSSRFGNVKLTADGVIYFCALLPDGQKRYAKMYERSIRFSGQVSSPGEARATRINTLDANGTGTGYEKMTQLDHLSPRSIFESKRSLEIQEMSINSDELYTTDRAKGNFRRPIINHKTFRFYWAERLSICITKETDAITLYLPSVNITSKNLSRSQGNINIQRTLKRDKLTKQRVCFNGHLFKVCQDQHEVQLDRQNQLIILK